MVKTFKITEGQTANGSPQKQLEIVSGRPGQIFEHAFELPDNSEILESVKEAETINHIFNGGEVQDFQITTQGDNAVVVLIMGLPGGSTHTFKFSLQPHHKAKMAQLLMPPLAETMQQTLRALTIRKSWWRRLLGI